MIRATGRGRTVVDDLRTQILALFARQDVDSSVAALALADAIATVGATVDLHERTLFPAQAQQDRIDVLVPHIRKRHAEILAEMQAARRGSAVVVGAGR